MIRQVEYTTYLVAKKLKTSTTFGYPINHLRIINQSLIHFREADIDGDGQVNYEGKFSNSLHAHKFAFRIRDNDDYQVNPTIPLVIVVPNVSILYIQFLHVGITGCSRI
jgi:hypothetical protein